MGVRACAMRATKCIVFVVLILSMAGCGARSRVGGGGGFFGIGAIFGDGGASEQGLPFRASLRRGDDRRDFTVNVRAGGVGVAQARESARFPATRYCVETYGGSEIDWTIDPNTGDWAFARDGQSMFFEGRCLAR